MIRRMRQEWTEDYTARAQAYWTEERTRALIGDKRPIILPGQAPMLLRALGLLDRYGAMPAKQVRKYRQINHMVAALQPSLRVLLDRFDTVRILDAACGRSYLSTLLAWTFVHHWRHPVQILGVDRNPALVEESRRRTELIDLEGVLRFEVASLDRLDVAAAWDAAFQEAHEDAPLHGLVSLHGCDTATDDALALALRYRCEMIAVVPCCQAELSAGWAQLAAQGDGGSFSPVWAGKHIARATAAHITDVFRLLLLRGAGYDASAIEFVRSEHTPKNTLIRGIRRSDGLPEALHQYQTLKAATGGVGIQLERHLPSRVQALLEERGRDDA